jgi:hypothetical protein
VSDLVDRLRRMADMTTTGNDVQDIVRGADEIIRLERENAALLQLLRLALPEIGFFPFSASGAGHQQEVRKDIEAALNKVTLTTTEGHSQGPSVSASPPSEAQHLLAAGDPLPCDVTCEGFGTFHRGVKLMTLLGYLGRRRHYNTLPAPTEEQKAAFQRVLAEARGEGHMEDCSEPKP